MARFWIVALITTTLVLAGCVPGASPPSDTTQEDLGAATSGTTAETTRSRSSPNKPPDSTLGFGARSVTGELGSYCWSSESSAVCVDAVYPLVPSAEKTLAVPAGSVMVFEYGGERPPDTVEAGAERLGPGGKPEGRPRPLETGGAGARVNIPADLPAGEHVVNVFVTVPEGDASYYFRVAVERETEQSGGY